MSRLNAVVSGRYGASSSTALQVVEVDSRHDPVYLGLMFLDSQTKRPLFCPTSQPPHHSNPRLEAPPNHISNLTLSIATIPSEMEYQSSIRTLFSSARNQRKELEQFSDPTSTIYQENLQAAIATLEECRVIADRITLFSPNETEEDISSGDLQ